MRVVPADARGQDGREQAAHLQTLARLASALHLKEAANRNCEALALARPNE
jgi:hypothetical protein